MEENHTALHPLMDTGLEDAGHENIPGDLSEDDLGCYFLCWKTLVYSNIKISPRLQKAGVQAVEKRLPGKSRQAQSIEDTYRQKTAGKRDAIAVLLSIWPVF